jgi:hypothetical protein
MCAPLMWIPDLSETLVHIYQTTVSIHSLRSLLRQLHSLLQRDFSTACNLVLSLSVSNVFLFSYGRPVVLASSPSYVSEGNESSGSKNGEEFIGF